VRLSIGNGGWVLVEEAENVRAPLYLRYRLVGGAWRPTELYLDGSEGPLVLAMQDLRGLPLPEITAAVNEFAEVMEASSSPGPNLSVFASHYASSLADLDIQEIAQGNWVKMALAAELVPPGEKSMTLVAPERHWERKGAVRQVTVSRVDKVRPKQRAKTATPAKHSDFRLAGPPVEGLTDEFLTDVARAHRAALSRGERPNKAISEQAGRPINTVQRWVALARQRGIMPPSGGRGVT
jgi:hypothetical protein